MKILAVRATTIGDLLVVYIEWVLNT